MVYELYCYLIFKSNEIFESDNNIQNIIYISFNTLYNKHFVHLKYEINEKINLILEKIIQ